MQTSQMILLLQVLIGLLFTVILGLIAFYLYVDKKKNNPKAEKKQVIQDSNQGEEKDKDKNQNYGRFQGELTQESIYEFMEFDEVVDNMIIRKNRTQFVMVLQCNGVNYDLMSEPEKISVEEGFVQFLNTLRFPIQLYVQSRTLNLKDIIEAYKERVETLKNDIEKLNAKIAQAKATGNRAVLEKLEFERRRKINVLEYGIDITDYVDRLSSNRNILQQKTYVIVSYFSSEIGGSLENYSKDEINSMCFTELYTRCQNVASALANSQVNSKILDSEELSELLYIAYNRDESELLQFSKALDSQYDSLYSTGKDVLQKKQEMIDKEITIDAIDVATDSIMKADELKKIEELDKIIDKRNKVKEKAKEIIGEYEERLDDRIFELAIEQVDKIADERYSESKDKKKKIETAEPKKKVVSSGKKIVRKKTEDKK
ncbi:MAG: hypothetical protein ACI4UE_05260 [Candidatus Scatovivens sp.]